MSEPNPNSPADVHNALHSPDSHLARENASLRQRLAELERQNVVEGRFTGEAPRYQLNERVYLDDTLFEPGTILDWIGEPNLQMVPINEPAKRKMEDHIQRLTYGAQRKAALAGRDFFGLVTDRNNLIDEARLDAQRAADAPVPVIQMPTAHGQVPAMPHTQEAQAAARRGPGRPRKATVVGQAQAAPSPVPQPMAAPFNPQSFEPAVVGRRVS